MCEALLCNKEFGFATPSHGLAGKFCISIRELDRVGGLSTTNREEKVETSGQLMSVFAHRSSFRPCAPKEREFRKAGGLSSHDISSMTSEMHHTRATLLSQLESWGIKVTTVDHEPLFTVEQSTQVHREVSGSHTKNLFLKDKKGALFLVTAEHGTQVNLKNLHKKLGCGRLSFANAELMQTHLGVTPGSVTALAVINDTEGRVAFILDQNLVRADVINAHPLVNTATTSLAREDLLAFVRKTGHDVTVIDLESDSTTPS